MAVRLTVCTTCKRTRDDAFDAKGSTGGELMLEALRNAAEARGHAPRTIGHECLWACTHHCVVLIQSAGRTGYLAGGFSPGPAAARAILDWCDAYEATADGTVAFPDWPEGMKGHFIARIPAARTKGDGA